MKKGKSLTEIEIEKEKEVMLKQAHLRSETFKNNAVGVGTLLMSGGVAILSAGVGIGAAAAGAGIGMVGAASSGGNSSNDSSSNPTPVSSSNSSASASQKSSSSPVLISQAKSERQAVALCGAVVVGYSSGFRMAYKLKCEGCGWLDSNTTSTDTPPKGSVTGSIFYCWKCKMKNEWKIQGIG